MESGLVLGLTPKALRFKSIAFSGWKPGFRGRRSLRHKMATIQPKGEKLRQAVRWISDQRLDHPQKTFSLLIQEAGERFNLSPKDEAYLESFYRGCDEP